MLGIKDLWVQVRQRVRSFGELKWLWCAEDLAKW